MTLLRERERSDDNDARAFLLSDTAEERVPKASSSATSAVDYAKFRGRSHDAVIRVYNAAGNVIETHEHAGDFKEP